MRRLCSMCSHYGLLTRQVLCRTLYIEGFIPFVAYATAPIVTSWRENCRVGFAPAKRPSLCATH